MTAKEQDCEEQEKEQVTETQEKSQMEVNVTEEEERGKEYPLKGSDIGLAFITSKTMGWPDRTMNLRKLT